MSKRAAVTEAEIKRAMSAAARCGLQVAECIMTPTEVRLVFSKVDDSDEDVDRKSPKSWG